MRISRVGARVVTNVDRWTDAQMDGKLNPYIVPCLVVVDLLFYVHGKHLRSCRDGQLT